LNSDAGFIEETGRASTGVVIRDMNGVVLVSAGRSLYHIASVLEAKALACLVGIRLARGWIHMPLCIGTDCMQLVHALEKDDQDRSRWAGLLKEIRDVMLLLPDVKIVL
jgi:hypothetical protein